MILPFSFCVDFGKSDCRLDVPNEGAHANFFVAHIEFFHGFEQRWHFVVVHHGDDARVHFGPSVCAAAWFTTICAASLHLFEECEAAHFERVEHVLHALGVGLVEYDHYRFHTNRF
jgi:hypothetical protein